MFLAAHACSDADKTAKRVITSNGVIVLAMRDCSRGMGAGMCALVWHDFCYFCRHTISDGIGAQSCAINVDLSIWGHAGLCDSAYSVEFTYFKQDTTISRQEIRMSGNDLYGCGIVCRGM